MECPRRKPQYDNGWTAIRACALDWGVPSSRRGLSWPERPGELAPPGSEVPSRAHRMSRVWTLRSPAGLTAHRGAPAPALRDPGTSGPPVLLREGPSPITSGRELGRSLLQVGRSDCGLEDICHLAQTLRQALPGWLQQVGHVRQDQALCACTSVLEGWRCLPGWSQGSTQHCAHISSRAASKCRKKRAEALLLVGKSFSEVPSVGPLGPHGPGLAPVMAPLLTAGRGAWGAVTS